MTKKMHARKVMDALAIEYPDVKCALNYTKPHELLIATRLSAQCTDVRVNIVTPKLFERYKTIDDFANADVSDVEELVKTCGLYKTKSRDIVMMSQILRDVYGGVIPDTIEELIKLPGVGRKTANLIVGDLYGKPALVCDTHVIRLTNRIGLAEGKDAFKVENQLSKIIPADEGLALCHRLVWHGRLVCNARNPKCNDCKIYNLCQYKSE